MEAQESQPLDVAAIREDFPILQRRVGSEVTPGTIGEDDPDGQQIVYLDNAATTQKPQSVIDEISRYYERYNANVHRGLHHLSQEASIAYELAHDRVAEFIGASGEREEIVFTSNTTEAENLVAYAWGLSELGPGDEIVLSEMEHHSSLVTWQQIAKKTGATVRYIRVGGDGRLDIYAAEMSLGENTTPRHYLFRNEGDGRFTESVVAEGVETHEAKAADLTGNGLPDIVGKSYTPDHHVDAWYNEVGAEQW
mgnify:CR=1 FL=1